VAFAIKTELKARDTKALVFMAQKTMYGGKHIAEGDTVFIFDSENEGGHGLWGRARVTSVETVAKSPGLARQTPRVSITVDDVVRATRALGRMDLKHFKVWDDGQPQTELNFKLYRQATNKIVGLSPSAAGFLESCFVT
jgi:hypothetical protein